MQLENSFTVPVPIDEAWRVLLDIERIAPCMPGAALDSVTGDDFTGRVKVKLGPINLTYQGKASFIEKDEAAHKAVIDGRGKDQRGNGTASALITAQLKAEGDTTRVDVLTDLNITGRPAQFGRGVMTDVGNKLLGQFADKLAAQLGAGDEGLVPAGAAAATTPPAPGAAATAAGAVEEIAASAETSGAPAPVKKAAAATRQSAAASADGASVTTPAGPAATPASTPAEPATAAPGAAAPTTAGTTTTPAGPAATQASTPARSAAAEPEPIDLLEVAGGAAMARYAAPLAGVAAALLVVALIVRRRRRR
ncbi:SRPBCC family protein [Geodermatophilus sabuli]|uniref:Carbon monoxide dehydrogenase subunit G n=1 Tax=Geodermatophilus sabuli TaxID=1564158 RepID=A0A285EJP9_9ACTN|nr:SRPBCC family protein [Geodermatophilus sabuli]MBB3086993.1 carbon monoxide dehydrogenase subunit G [Geodermatophilus sabuli]SNX99227.1 Carbon monoxide dehydrogenase subunit G [Geodermatophilus sabuli]